VKSEVASSNVNTVAALGVGSSKIKILGLFNNTCAISIRCFMDYETCIYITYGPIAIH